MTPTIRFAIVGYGNIGSRHAQHIMQHREARLVAIADNNPHVEAKIPAGVIYAPSMESLLSEHASDLDVVCVCTPNYLHEVHTIQTLQAGLHAVVEKPMAISTASCNRMIDASKATPKLIFAVKQNRYNPPVQQAKQLIDSGALGKVYFIQVNCFWNRGDNYYKQSNWRGKKAEDGGCLFTQFSHFIDILYYLNGGIASSVGKINNYAHLHNTELEDTGTFTMTAQNGALVNFNFTTCTYQKNMEGSITIIAEKGTLKIGGQYLNTIEYQHIEGKVLPDININAKANDYGIYQGSMSNHDKVIQNVIDVLNHNMPIMTTAEEGRDVVQMIELMYGTVQ
ncbi:MAG: gfo/Idh/MocA family oxidoreductase [Chitinophagia bacterium]|nr:gfo/Idh/MocA family oxidoreductase [Chitinophagia bacterium]